MKTIINTIPGYRVNEYLLVLSPHEELWNRIVKVKTEFSEKYKSDHEDFAGQYKSDYARWGKPHITLVNFVQYAMLEERIVSRLHNIAMGFPPFKVELKDYGSFPSHTIYINVTSKLPVQNLVKNIRTESQRLMKLNDDNKPHFIMDPHMTIARKLLPWQYEKGWLEYSNSQFTGRFMADHVLLMRKQMDAKKYEVVKRFKLLGQKQTIEQSSLFDW